jgi:hypothetical protein
VDGFLSEYSVLPFPGWVADSLNLTPPRPLAPNNLANGHTVPRRPVLMGTLRSEVEYHAHFCVEKEVLKTGRIDVMQVGADFDFQFRQHRETDSSSHVYAENV